MSLVIVLPDALVKNTNKEEQKELAEFFDKLAKSSSEATILTAEEKFEKRLTEEISKLHIKISETRSDIIKWMFIFWVGQIGVLVAILSLFFKH
ncbi:MAG: hypothetical protein ACYCTB_04605 [bacterium]